MARASLSPERLAPGDLAFPGRVIMVTAHPSGMFGTRAAALLAGVQPPTIRSWRRRGWLAPQGLDELGYPLHTAIAIRAAEELARQHGIEASGIDPRQLRGRTAVARAA